MLELLAELAPYIAVIEGLAIIVYIWRFRKIGPTKVTNKIFDAFKKIKHSLVVLRNVFFCREK